MTLTISRDLRSMLGPARDQGPRPTCLAFAASDTHAALRPDWVPLSCEYAYYHAIKRHGNQPHRGATLPAMLEAIREDGQPPEEVWKYLQAVPTNISQWKPPQNITPLYKRDSGQSPLSVDQILKHLDAGIPIIVTMSLSNAFYSPSADGIVSSMEAPDPSRRHAVVAVGYGTRRNEKFILTRNSWGSTWGIFGYAWLSEGYLVPRLLGIAELTKDLTNVPTNKAA